MKFSGVTILQGVEFSIFSERDTYVHVRYMLSAVRLSSVCLLSVCRLSSVCNVGAPYSAG